MKFISSFIILIFAGIMNLHSQEKILQLNDLIPGGNTYQHFRPSDMKGASWCGDTFVYNEDDAIVATNKEGRKMKKPFISLVQLNQALTTAHLKELKGLPSFSYSEKGDEAFFYAQKHIITYDIQKRTIENAVPYQEEDKNFDFNTTRSFVAVNNGTQLFLIASDGTRREISDEKQNGIVWGQSVHRNEFGINKGTFWSPDGKQLAFYRMDESMVTTYPLVDISQRIASVSEIRYPMAGMPSHQVTVGVYNCVTGKTVYLKTGEPKDHYLTNIAWTPDSKSILIAELNRDQNNMDLNRYDVQTGERINTLFNESSEIYVEPQNPPYFISDDTFIWQSDRDGFNHLYLYNINGQLIRQLTEGKWMVKQILRYNKKSDKLYYTSTEVSALEDHLFELHIKNGERRRLTSGEGMHYVKINTSTTCFYDRYSSLNNPGTSEICSISSGKRVRLMQSANPYDGYTMPEIVLGTIKAADGITDLHYRMTKPSNFDAKKRYPVIIYLYNGPHAQLVINNWQGGERGWDIFMAEKGYLMFTVDGRGSANRGRDFEQVIHLKVGEQEGKDQMEGVNFLKSLPYVDASRIGIHGWSYGGFMTTYMMLTYPEVFKVGVAGGPVINWEYYEVMYGERYMGHPDKNKEGYQSSNLLNKVQNLKGRLLLIHGDMDPVVVQQNSLSFLKKSVEVGVYPDYFIYPGHEHNVRGIDRVHLHEKISRYFDDFL